MRVHVKVLVVQGAQIALKRKVLPRSKVEIKFVSYSVEGTDGVQKEIKKA